MKLNNFMFKEEYAYTYEEVLIELQGTTYLSGTTLCEMLDNCGLLPLLANQKYDNKYAYSFLPSGQIEEDDVPARTLNLLNKVALRYGQHYAVVVSSQEEFENASINFMRKLCNDLDYTFEKYDALLSMYADNKSKLLDKLERTRSEEKSGESEISSESSSGSKSAGSDTPQTINVSQDIGEIAGYFNRYDQAQDEASSSSEGSNSETIEATETFDPTTLMARIDEIQKQYENTMFKWVEEFDRLFIEEGNI